MKTFHKKVLKTCLAAGASEIAGKEKKGNNNVNHQLFWRVLKKDRLLYNETPWKREQNNEKCHQIKSYSATQW